MTRNELFSKRADVYPFGTVIYELFVRAKPFPHLADGQGTAFLNQIHFPNSCANTYIFLTTLVAEVVESGVMPELPPGTQIPKVLYELMRRCWDSVPTHRPHFTEIKRILKDLLRKIRARQRIEGPDGGGLGEGTSGGGHSHGGGGSVASSSS